MLPDLAVTTSVYEPACVPSVELLLFEPPPQAPSRIANSGTKLQRSRGVARAAVSCHISKHPRTTKAQSQVVIGKCGRKTPVCVVVVTETLIFEAVFALNAVVAGTLQLAPVGAPVQVNVALPATPWPPIDSE